jgi:hypothetical protein
MVRNLTPLGATLVALVLGAAPGCDGVNPIGGGGSRPGGEGFVSATDNVVFICYSDNECDVGGKMIADDSNAEPDGRYNTMHEGYAIRNQSTLPFVIDVEATASVFDPRYDWFSFRFDNEEAENLGNSMSTRVALIDNPCSNETGLTRREALWSIHDEFDGIWAQYNSGFDDNPYNLLWDLFIPIPGNDVHWDSSTASDNEFSIYNERNCGGFD